MTNIALNLKAIQKKLDEALNLAQRPKLSAKLIAVSKGKSAEDVLAAIEAGQRVFGENRVQEAAQKFSPLKANYPDLELHLIGPLQTNKVEAAVALFDVIETLDRKNLAQALQKSIAKIKRHPICYIEVNIGAEPQKTGVMKEELPEFLDFCHQSCGLSVQGLMCIPPQNDDPSRHFAELKRLADDLKLKDVSMGMSGDFEIALKEGATKIRVGQAIFGER